MSSSVKKLFSNVSGLLTFVRYNAAIIFAGRFIYFLLLAVALFLTIIVIYSLEESVPPQADAIYYFLLAPGILLVLYPATYSIQSDIDSRMLETLFGIPDYRYKVWLARNITQYLTISGLLLLLILFCRIALASFSVTTMLFHIIFPIIFLGSLGFMIATYLKSGNGSAAVLIVIVLFFWIAAEWLDGSRWDLFHNPFARVDMFEKLLWEETTLYNRIYIFVASTVMTLFGLLRLQQREKYI